MVRYRGAGAERRAIKCFCISNSTSCRTLCYLRQACLGGKTPGQESLYTLQCVYRLVMTACLSLLTLSSSHEEESLGGKKGKKASLRRD